jgi:heme exporter protein D
MNWHGWSEFLAMGGYGLYVWGSYAVTLLIMVGEVAALALRRRGVVDSLRKYYAARGKNHEAKA